MLGNPDHDACSLRMLKNVMDQAVGVATPGGFVNKETNSKAKRSAVKVVTEEARFSGQHTLVGQLFYTKDEFKTKWAEDPLAVKMIAFVLSQGILNMWNENASPYDVRVAAFRGVGAVAFHAMGIEEHAYEDITPEKMMAMGVYMAKLRRMLS